MKLSLFIVFAFLFNFSGFAQLYFPPNGSNDWDTMPIEDLNWCQDKIDALYQFLDDNDSKAFILLKDGRVYLVYQDQGVTHHVCIPRNLIDGQLALPSRNRSNSFKEAITGPEELTVGVVQPMLTKEEYKDKMLAAMDRLKEKMLRLIENDETNQALITDVRLELTTNITFGRDENA